jgi:predicted DNA-binding protein (MmcQ/YjbR family)
MVAAPRPRAGALAKLRALALALPTTRETSRWGHPNFRTSARIFCAFHESRDGVPTIWLRLDPLAAELLRGDPRIVASGHGRLGWLGVRADGGWTFVRELLGDAHRLALPEPNAARAKPATKRARTRRR